MYLFNENLTRFISKNMNYFYKCETNDKLMRIIKWYREHKTGSVKLVPPSPWVGDKFTYQICKCNKCCGNLILTRTHIKHTRV